MKEVGMVKVHQNTEVPLSTVVGEYGVIFTAVTSDNIECELFMF